MKQMGGAAKFVKTSEDIPVVDDDVRFVVTQSPDH